VNSAAVEVGAAVPGQGRPRRGAVAPVAVRSHLAPLTVTPRHRRSPHQPARQHSQPGLTPVSPSSRGQYCTIFAASASSRHSDGSAVRSTFACAYAVHSERHTRARGEYLGMAARALSPLRRLHWCPAPRIRHTHTCAHTHTHTHTHTRARAHTHHVYPPPHPPSHQPPHAPPGCRRTSSPRTRA
jgi:hypothetical protein